MKSTSSLIIVLAIALFSFLGLISRANPNHSNIFQDTAKPEKIVAAKDSVEKVVIDKKLANQGKGIFNSKCFACHKLDQRLVGPPLRNITKTLSTEYLTKYLSNTSEMQKNDPNLKKLIKEYNGVLMPDQNLNKKQVAAVIEYLLSVVK